MKFKHVRAYRIDDTRLSSPLERLTLSGAITGDKLDGIRLSLSHRRAASAIKAQRLALLAEMLGMDLALIGHVQTIGLFQRPLKIMRKIFTARRRMRELRERYFDFLVLRQGIYTYFPFNINLYC